MPQTYSLFKSEEGDYLIRHWKVDHTGKRRSTKHPLQACDVDPILVQLFKLKLPIAQELIPGCDGGFTEIELGDYWGGSKFRWWSVPPEGWEELDTLVSELLGLVSHADDPAYFAEG